MRACFDGESGVVEAKYDKNDREDDEGMGGSCESNFGGGGGKDVVAAVLGGEA